ncbi:hypothetical protein GCM10023093_27670 [Nemorincola caseinilytica]|uniref:NodB homology domain-containing protein n=1 Tax=Nemorincola caseinilytica TaxID=2054315 RepID=A0ABP8NKU1_9BACT
MSDRPVEYYKDVKRKKAPLRGYLRDIALTYLARFADESYLARPRVQFLYLHHIFKDEEAGLDALLQRLGKDHEFISYSSAVDKVLSGNIDKPYISFSSDDGFRNNLKAAEIMNKYGVKACFFINPGITGETDPNKIKRHCSDTLHFPTVDFLNWDDVNTLLSMGHEIGSQTMMHMNMARTPAAIVSEDVQRSFDVLSAKCGDVKHFAFPYGRFSDLNSNGKKAVFDAGFTSCASAVRGCHITSGGPIPHTQLCIRRDHIVLAWDIAHIMYFITRNARNANSVNNFFPSELR